MFEPLVDVTMHFAAIAMLWIPEADGAAIVHVEC
jgi:hypothetical protein